MRRSDRLSQQRALYEVVKEIGLGSPAQKTRLAELLDMHLTRRGLCIVTVDERNLLPHPSTLIERDAVETS